MGAFVGLLVGLVIGIVILMILGLIVQWLWNTTLPNVLGVKPVTTVQAIKILFLTSLLFGGYRVVEYQVHDEIDTPPVAVPAPAPPAAG